MNVAARQRIWITRGVVHPYYATPLRKRIGLASLALAILANILSQIVWRYMPGYSGPGGLDSWYWRLLDEGQYLLLLLGFVIGAGSWRHWAGRLAMALCAADVAWMWHEL